jgi:hypothetical protein
MCDAKALETIEFLMCTFSDEHGRRFPGSYHHAACRACGADLVRDSRVDGWITKQAWDAGVRTALPKATTVRE